MITFLTIIHVTAIVLLVVVILLQSGKGAEISASFGGSSQTVFGSSGGANFFTRLTAILAATFFSTSLALTLAATHSKKSVFEGTKLPVAGSTAPQTDAAKKEVLPTGKNEAETNPTTAKETTKTAAPKTDSKK